MGPVPQTDRLVQVHLVAIRASFCGSLCVFAKNARCSFPPVADELLHRCRARRRHEHAVVETVVPEVVERCVATLLGVQRLSPEPAKVFVEIPRPSEPLQQALVRCARLEERRDRRLRKTVEGSDWLGVSPCFEEVMIRTYGIAQRGRLV